MSCIIIKNIPNFDDIPTVNKKENKTSDIKLEEKLKEELEEEPYYILRRRIDNIINNKTKKKPYDDTLSLLNKLFETKYERLLDIKNIKVKHIPKRKKFAKILKEHIKIESHFDMIYDKKTPTYIIINNILSKIGYSFICKKENSKLRFNVKAYSYSYII